MSQGEYDRVSSDLAAAQTRIQSLQADLSEAQAKIQSLESDKKIAGEKRVAALAYAE